MIYSPALHSDLLKNGQYYPRQFALSEQFNLHQR
jgi:hypothetical protein